MKKITLTWVISISMALSFAVQAKEVIYRWVDEKGVVHYSTHPPAGQKAEKVNLHSGKGKGVKPAPAKTAKQPAPEPETAKPQPEAAKPASLKDPELCKQAKQNLWNLKNRGRIYILDQETGERRAMPDEERQQRIEETEKEIADYCNN